MSWVQVGLFCAESFLAAGIVLLLFRLRYRFGLAPLFVTLGVFQLLQNLLTLTLGVNVGSFVASPGSMVLFPVTLFAVLLIYIREDASEARQLVYGLVAANLAMSVLWAIFGYHMADGDSNNLLDLSAKFFRRNAGMSAIGLVVLFVDALLVIWLYEALRRIFREWILPRVFLTLTLVLAFDSLVFVTAVFFQEDNYLQLVLSNLVGKSIAALPLAVWMTLYLSFVPEVEEEGTFGTDTGGIRLDAFHRMSYRERYESMKEQVVRDPLTGLYNRGFFDEVLPLTLERAKRSNEPASLLMLDIDDFKALNDAHGHLAGDAVLRKVSEVLQDSARSEDAPCRFGGDEFALLLQDASGFSAKLIAERIRKTLSEVELTWEGKSMPLAVTIGVATYPTDAASPSELIMLADRRLYRGKHRGGDALVDGQTTSGILS